MEGIRAEGHPVHRTRFYEGWEMIAELEFGNAHPFYQMTVFPQAHTEAILTAALAARGIHPERGVTFEALAQDNAGVTATLARANGERETTRAPLLLGADGPTAGSGTRSASPSTAQPSLSPGRSMTFN
jgi:2-polyprenyl-6-methoxyphenol hydroxylase-like FAD-dependent oxidoreductase